MLAGSDTLTQEFYALAGQILTELAQNTGRRGKMLPAVERAKTDPARFAAMLSPATLQRLRDLSVKLRQALPSRGPAAHCSFWEPWRWSTYRSTPHRGTRRLASGSLLDALGLGVEPN